MEPMKSNQLIYIKVEGQCHSNHRSPQGVYRVEVVPEKTMAHSACAAIQVARELVPFLSENPDSFALRAFSEDGREITGPRTLRTAHEAKGHFFGRAKNYPESITVQ